MPPPSAKTTEIPRAARDQLRRNSPAHSPAEKKKQINAALSMEVDVPSTNLPPYPQESLLIDAIPELAGERFLCTSLGLAQLAGAAAQALPHASVSCTYLDLYRANLALEHWHDRPANL